MRALLAGAAAALFLLAGCGDPPRATFTVTPDAPRQAGQELRFLSDVSCSRGATRRMAWDVDGDGRFERGPEDCDEAEVEDFRHTYARPGTYKVSTWAQVPRPVFVFGFLAYADGYSSQRLVIGSDGPPAANQPPVPDFTANPNPGYTERPVNLDAAPSRDPDGRIVKYEWDRDGDGTWDANGPTTSYATDRAGTLQVRLRVTDDDGATATTERAVPIVDGVPPGESLRAAAAARAARATRFSTVLSGKLTSQGRRFVAGATFSGTGIKARGRMRLAGLPSPLRGKRRARWAATLTTKQKGTTRAARLAASGYLLLDLRGGDRLCMNGRLGGRLGSPFTGRLAVVGGTGKGRRIRGTARLTVPVVRRARLRGTLNLARSKKARKLPRPCRALV
ncbi:MAG TPA: PKD domain-containing protein, partial [Thermoleophilaceae bacterium]|nr:PKD domain-containing protein [Thermoleophilaceae bacterium]